LRVFAASKFSFLEETAAAMPPPSARVKSQSDLALLVGDDVTIDHDPRNQTGICLNFYRCPMRSWFAVVADVFLT